MLDENRGEAVMGGVEGVAVGPDRVTHVGRRPPHAARTTQAGHEAAGWVEVDRALRACAGRRAELDAEEARWLVAAERVAVHRRLGCASIHEYLERVLGYGPRAARDRLRVARALADLPAMMAALGGGELCHSAVRELIRVATPETEVAWLEAARGKCLREIEQAVSGRERGDLPDDPDDAPPRPMTIELEVSAATMALYREALRRLESELGEPLTDDRALALMCVRVLEAQDSVARDDDGDVAGADDGDAGPDEVGDGGGDPDQSPDGVDRDRSTGRATSNQPPYQIAITTCDSCKRGWHDAAGREVAQPPAETARAWCDAHVLGRVDGNVPARVTRTIPPAIRRQVFRRDRGRCIVPGCRSARFLEVHHVIPRAAGGTHDPRHLAVMCFAHHQAAHAGRLQISGEAPAFDVRRLAAPIGPAEPTHVGRAARAAGPPPPSSPIAPPPAMVDDAVTALRQAGFSRAEAMRGVSEAASQISGTTLGSRRATPPPTLESLIAAALRALRPRA